MQYNAKQSVPFKVLSPLKLKCAHSVGENPTAIGLSSAVPDTVHISAAVARSSQGCDCVS